MLHRGLGVAGALHLVSELVFAAHLIALVIALALAVEVVFEDWILEDFFENQLGQLHRGQLQQPNRLLKLGGHHQLLR